MCVTIVLTDNVYTTSTVQYEQKCTYTECSYTIESIHCLLVLSNINYMHNLTLNEMSGTQLHTHIFLLT